MLAKNSFVVLTQSSTQVLTSTKSRHLACEVSCSSLQSCDLCFVLFPSRQTLLNLLSLLCIGRWGNVFGGGSGRRLPWLEEALERHLSFWLILRLLNVTTGGLNLQGDGEMFAEVAVEGGVSWLTEALERHLSFWSGAAPPAAVSQEDAWKCGHCAFRQQCQAGIFYTAQRLCY